MEGIASEVSHKIRAAIKAKLIELGAYVDDELPDYIMVMVANKKTRAQMDEDLHLFLSSSTKIFTSWLHTVLQKLQEVTVANFENKKDSDSKKSSKRKRSDTEDLRSRKSSEEASEKVKKRPKKHKEAKKNKKNKYKSKEKTKSKKGEKEEMREKSGKEEEEKRDGEDGDKKDKAKTKKVELNEVVGKAILGDLKKNKKLKSDKHESSVQSAGSSSQDGSHVNEKSTKEGENGKNGTKRRLSVHPVTGIEGFSVAEVSKMAVQGEVNAGLNMDDKPAGERDFSQKSKKEVVEDEFNIEPLEPVEKENEMESRESNESKTKKAAEPNIQGEKTISAPTEELLKEHDKIQNEQLKGEEKKPLSDSEESLSPEEIRKQLLLSRAKKKLEESKKAERMRSNSPEVQIVEETAGLGGGRQKDLLSASSRQPDVRSTRSTHSGGKESSHRPSRRSLLHSDRSQSSERSPYRRGPSDYKSKRTESRSPNEERKRMSESRSGKNSQTEREKERKNADGEKKKNIIRISETLEMEKNLGMKRETGTKAKEKEISRKRPVSSRVVTITAPEAPEIPSIVKVKPREFISKDKQANKALILKAVADAEKSIATLQVRPEIATEPKKEALYTKKLREKRYEKLAVTLSNIRRSPNSRDRLGRRVSADSDRSDKSLPKRDSSDVSEGMRVKSDLLSKKISKSEDQFISSKTTIMEKNDKYIRCWLEGVEKAVKDDEMLNPSEMDDFVHSNPTDEENDVLEKDDEKKRKRKATEGIADLSAKALKLSEKEIANLRVIPNSGVNREGPQIVVTLDGLDTKTIKDLILKNKGSGGKPLLSSGKNPEKNSGVSKDKSPGESRKPGIGKISDRFGRLNKVNEEELTKSEEKSSKRESSDAEKKSKAGKESKNRQLIAQLSEKFGKIDREFESRKRKRPDEDRRYPYDSRRNGKEDGDKNGRYRKSERRSFREGGFGFYRRS